MNDRMPLHEEIYRLGARHEHRVTELLRHNNEQLEENRAQRQQIKALKRVLERIGSKLQSVCEANRENAPEAVNLFAGEAEQLVKMALGPGYTDERDDKVGELSRTILGALLEGDSAADTKRVREELPALAEHISQFLEHEFGV